VVFGGVSFLGLSAAFYQDTWSFVNDVWTPVIQGGSCTPATCPSPRAGAMMAYYPTEDALLLFGGFSTAGLFSPINADNDTWLYANSTWTNITATAGTAPSPRFEGVMSYDPSDNYVVLFGGSDANGNSLEDTWKFSGGTWTNLSANYAPGDFPEARAGAAVAASPDGHVMVYGGEDGSTIIENSCDNGTGLGLGDSAVAWWFFGGKWTVMNGWGYICPPPIPAGTQTSPPPLAGPIVEQNPPCGRINPALGWSPKNDRFALYGGYGPTNPSTCTGGPNYLNDTWTYGAPSGDGFSWFAASDSGDPGARYEMGYASDFTDGYFEIFGGYSGTEGYVNETWRFYETVHASLTGPPSFDTAGINFGGPFIVVGYGGSGALDYTLSVKGLRNSNSLNSGTGCGNFTDGASPPLPYDGVVTVPCEPGPKSFNVYRLTVLVTDSENTSAYATANWTVSILPPESIALYSEYISYFYAGITLNNKFSIYAEVANGPPKSISATLGGTPVNFHPRSGAPKWWDATVDMSSVAPGAILSATAQFGNWTQNVTYEVNIITPPSWLLTLFHFTGATQTISSAGAGPDNKTFTIDEAYSWNLGEAAGFNLPIPLVGGDYDLIPSINVVFSATSTGNLSITGTFTLSPPTIDIGPASLKLTASLSLSGKFEVVGTGVQWLSASAIISVTADLSASVPIYGFSILGITIGFVLDISISPSITLSLILAPTTESSQEIISGIGIMVQQLLGSFTLALQAAVDFGIGIASVGLGVGLSVAVSFSLDPSLDIAAGWVNGSIFVQASFLFWSDQWNIASGSIYTWGSADPATATDAARPGTGYNNGSGTTWVMHNRYYVSGAYDANVWNSIGSSGAAISDIYPFTEVTGAGGYNGAYLFYTDDNASEPLDQGLQVSGVQLSTSTNDLIAIPTPKDPGFAIVAPQAATLPNGDIYVAWDALPLFEVGDGSPLNLTSLALHGAEFDPATDSWGPVHLFNFGNFAQSYRVDATGTSGEVEELTSTVPLIGDSTPERLVEYDIASGNVLANVSVSGISELTSFRGATELVNVQLLNGNYSSINVTNADPVGPAYMGGNTTSESFATGSTSTQVVLTRTTNASVLTIYDVLTGQTLATLGLGANASEAEGFTSGGTTYVFVRTAQGIEGWSVSGATFSNLTSIGLPQIESYGLVQAGGSLVIYSLVTNGNISEPIAVLYLSEIGASLAPVPVPASVSGGASSTSGPAANYGLYLGIIAVGVALLLAVVYLATRRRPPTSSAPTVEPPIPPAGATGAPPPPE
jgi:hypothetical protein